MSVIFPEESQKVGIKKSIHFAVKIHLEADIADMNMIAAVVYAVKGWNFRTKRIK